uniref:CD83 molecule n=1 Tax=Zosterops lateralis melanops TaxID=1220523 RepID=A0A8D2P428_ZOSLA
MSLGDCALLIFLCNVWCLVRGTSVMIPDVVVKCAEEVVLPCKALQDPSISYQTASWYKMAEDGKGVAWEVFDVEFHYPQEVEGSLELSNGTSFSLTIKNATSRNSGTYKCTLRGQNGERNLSSTVTLKVTGCPGIEEDKLKKYRSELLMLTFLGVFYLLLIFFTCTCLRKESMSPSDQKTRPGMKHMLTLINVHEITSQHLNNNGTCKNELTSSSV